MWGVSAQPKGVRHECYDCIGQSCHCLESCFEIDRPSWQTGSSPPRSKPITLPAASRLPLATIGAAGSADSMSARAIMSPLQMPDIRLQAHPNCHNYRSTSCPAGGVHIRRVRPVCGGERDVRMITDRARAAPPPLAGRPIRHRRPDEPARRLHCLQRYGTCAARATTSTLPARRARRSVEG